MNPNTPRKNPALKWVATGAAALGLAVGAAGLASAASGNDSDSDTADTVVVADDQATTDAGDQGTPPADAPDPASLPNGPGETLLTGTELAEVTAAAEAAEPRATVIRAETDSSGHAYEVHVQTADGSYKTLYFDESFAADGSDEGFGPAPAGQHPQGPPSDDATAVTTAG